MASLGIILAHDRL